MESISLLKHRSQPQEVEPPVKEIEPEVKAAFAFEDPKYMSIEQLQPLSRRKLWKIKHKKRIHKSTKRLRNGYQVPVQ